MENILVQNWQRVVTIIDANGTLIVFLLFVSVLILGIILLLEILGNRKYREQHLTLLEGVHIANLEEFMLKKSEEIEELQETVKTLKKDLVIMEQIQGLAIQKVGMVRYNPFIDISGDQSFSITLLDGREDGLVITGIYGREETRLFAKPIKGGKSRYRLTDEELLAMDRARNDKHMGSLMAEGGGVETL